MTSPHPSTSETGSCPLAVLRGPTRRPPHHVPAHAGSIRAERELPRPPHERHRTLQRRCRKFRHRPGTADLPTERARQGNSRRPRGRSRQNRPAAAERTPADRDPTVTATRARGANQGRQDAAAPEVASERVTDPERAAGAPAPSTAPDDRRSGPGHPEGGADKREREGRPRPPERTLTAIRTRAQRGRRGASRGGRPGSAGQTRVQRAKRTKPAVRHDSLCPFSLEPQQPTWSVSGGRLRPWPTGETWQMCHVCDRSQIREITLKRGSQRWPPF